MERPGFEVRVTGLLALVACVAFNLWLFRHGPLPGLIGLNLTKHVAIAAICREAGVNRRRGERDAASPAGVAGPGVGNLPRPDA